MLCPAILLGSVPPFAAQALQRRHPARKVLSPWAMNSSESLLLHL